MSRLEPCGWADEQRAERPKRGTHLRIYFFERCALSEEEPDARRAALATGLHDEGGIDLSLVRFDGRVAIVKKVLDDVELSAAACRHDRRESGTLRSEREERRRRERRRLERVRRRGFFLVLDLVYLAPCSMRSWTTSRSAAMQAITSGV